MEVLAEVDQRDARQVHHPLINNMLKTCVVTFYLELLK